MADDDAILRIHLTEDGGAASPSGPSPDRPGRQGGGDDPFSSPDPVFQRLLNRLRQESGYLSGGPPGGSRTPPPIPPGSSPPIPPGGGSGPPGGSGGLIPAGGGGGGGLVPPGGGGGGPPIPPSPPVPPGGAGGGAGGAAGAGALGAAGVVGVAIAAGLLTAEIMSEGIEEFGDAVEEFVKATDRLTATPNAAALAGAPFQGPSQLFGAAATATDPLGILPHGALLRSISEVWDQAGKSMENFIEGLDRITDDLSQFNADAAFGKAEALLATIEAQLRRGDAIGEDLGQLASTRGDIEAAMTDIQTNFLRPILPIVNELAELMKNVLELIAESTANLGEIKFTAVESLKTINQWFRFVRELREEMGKGTNILEAFYRAWYRAQKDQDSVDSKLKEELDRFLRGEGLESEGIPRISPAAAEIF